VRAFTVGAVLAFTVDARKALTIFAMASPIDIIQSPFAIVVDKAKSGSERRLPVLTAVDLCHNDVAGFFNQSVTFYCSKRLF